MSVRKIAVMSRGPGSATGSTATMCAPSRSQATRAAPSPSATSGSSSARSSTAIVRPSSGRGPGRAWSGSLTSAGGGISGVTCAPPAVSPWRSAAQSAIERAIGPAWSSDGASAITPSIGTRPCVALIALVPHSAEGIRSEPSVSVPSAAGTIRAASAAAEPPLEPPAERSGAHGLPT